MSKSTGLQKFTPNFPLMCRESKLLHAVGVWICGDVVVNNRAIVNILVLPKTEASRCRRNVEQHRFWRVSGVILTSSARPVWVLAQAEAAVACPAMAGVPAAAEAEVEGA